MTARTCLPALAIACLLAFPGLGRAADPLDTLTQLPRALVGYLSEYAIAAEDASVWLQQVDTDQPRLSVNAESSRAPASTIKILTTAAGLDVLGAGYRWKTRVLMDGKLSDGTLDGDLIIRGYGDPFLDTQAFASLLRALRAKGIRDIKGDLVLDNSRFEPPRTTRAAFDGKSASSYNALPSPLSVNRQVTEVVLWADKSAKRVAVYTDPPLANLEIKNTAKLVNASCKGRNGRPLVRAGRGPGPTLEVKGKFPSECADRAFNMLLVTPQEQAAGAFRALWGELGGTLAGRVVESTEKRGGTTVLNTQSVPMVDVVREINKKSNNLMARTLFLTLGLEKYGAPASLEGARDAVYAWLSKHDLVLPKLHLDNGSGLSRETRISAAGMGALLDFAWRRPWMPELLSSLSIIGVDGTTAKRLRHDPIVGRAHLKTGTLRNASAIAGYVLDRHHRRWALVVMLSGKSVQVWKGRAFQHEVLRWVYDGAGLDTPQTDANTTAAVD